MIRGLQTPFNDRYQRLPGFVLDTPPYDSYFVGAVVEDGADGILTEAHSWPQPYVVYANHNTAQYEHKQEQRG